MIYRIIAAIVTVINDTRDLRARMDRRYGSRPE